MSPDECRRADTRAWLIRSNDDLGTAKDLLESGALHVRAIVFHSQQSAEKSLKAFLTWHDRVFPKSHDLRKLGQLVAEVDAGLEPILQQAAGLTDYAWRFRYPGEPYEPTVEETQKAVTIAGEVYATVMARLPVEVAP